MGKKPIVSVTYENEKISIKKNSLPYTKCVSRLSCVVRGPRNGHKSASSILSSRFVYNCKHGKLFYKPRKPIKNIYNRQEAEGCLAIA